MSLNRGTTEYVFFEHGKPLILQDTSNEEVCRKKFDSLGNYLEKIWINRENKVIYGKINDQKTKGTNQPILNLNYKDYSLTSNQYVGVINTGDFRLTLLPKIFQSLEGQPNESIVDKASENLMYLMSYAYDLRLPEPKGNFGTNKMDFIEMFIFLFAEQTLKTLNRNFYHSYETVEENLGFIKGKILFQENLKFNLSKGRKDKTFCRYTVFQENNLFNQIIKYVTRNLLINTRHAINKNLLHQILYLLVDVDERICIYSDTEKIIFNRTQQEFEPILNYCKLFLNGNLVKFTNKNFDIFCFLLDMNSLFEKFVAKFINKHFTEYKVTIQKSDKYVAQRENGEKVFQMKHDIYLTSLDRQIIIDTKYKETNFLDKKGGVSQNDIYQMTTYSIRRSCPELILLYPEFCGDSSPKETNYTITDEFSKSRIQIKCFKLNLLDLNGSKKQKDEIIRKQLQQALKSE